MSGFDWVHILLARVEGPINLGLIARAMANTGFGRLHFSGPLRGDEEPARRFAVHAGGLLARAERAGDLDELVRPCDRIVGFTPRLPWADGRDLPFEELGATVARWTAEGRRTGLLFGNEAHGLNNEELARCDRRVALPTSADYPSMNLAMAVAGALWPVRLALLASEGSRVAAPRVALVDGSRKDLLARKLNGLVDAMDFLGDDDPDGIRQELELIFRGREWTEREWRLLIALFNKAASRYRALEARGEGDRSKRS